MPTPSTADPPPPTTPSASGQSWSRNRKLSPPWPGTQQPLPPRRMGTVALGDRQACGIRLLGSSRDESPPRTHPSSQGHRNPRTGLGAALENSPDGSMPVMRWRRSSSAAGTVALADRRSCGILVERAVRSDRQQEFVECGSQPQTRNRVGPEFVVTTSQVLNERMPPDHDTRGPDRPQSPHRTKTYLQPAVITLAPVVLILPGVMEGRRDQLVDHMGECRCAVGDHLDRQPMRGQRGGEELPGRSDIAPGGHVHINHLTVLVCGPVHIPPQASDLHVRLTGKPPVPHAMPAWAGRLGQLGSEALHPPVQRET